MSSEPATVTLATADHGQVTIPEPTWCAGHQQHDPDSARSDLGHAGPDITLAFHGRTLSVACLDQAPFAVEASREPVVSEFLVGKSLDPVGVYELAAAYDRYADQLRDLADQLTAILAGGSQ
ncbi:DUF6907 domain-containing protein [Streptomyces collinus]|uniref:DUF6907 domain-containing protein n=1 Tax=Streptomyces collinus TaxID=42684 RepID=UPI00367F950E